MILMRQQSIYNVFKSVFAQQTYKTYCLNEKATAVRDYHQ